MQTPAASLSCEEEIQRGLGAEHRPVWASSAKFGIQTPEVNRLSCRENIRIEEKLWSQGGCIFLPISLANRGEMSPRDITSVTCDPLFAVQFKGGIRLNRCRQLKHPACTTNPKKLESLRCLRTTNCSTVCGFAVVCIPSPSGAG